jgi:UDP-galactopyranose mutase
MRRADRSGTAGISGSSAGFRKMEPIDLLIAGAGPVGCVVAERAAKLLGWKCLIIDKRPHVAGNCFDTPHSSGVLIHRYGPHYFRTNSKPLLDYLSNFTEWIPGNYIAKSFAKGQLFPFPINLTTLELFFKRSLTESEAAKLLEKLQEKFENPKNSEEFVLSRVGRELYEAFYLGYTLKQWEKHPRELMPSVCGRIPVRLNRDESYVDHQYQVMPARGFTEMFRKMIDHPLIEVRLNTDFNDVKMKINPRKATLYCGPADEYFDRSLGVLPWRSLEFKLKEYDQEFVQPCVQINYPDLHEYTRAVEIKHVTAQKHPKTVLSFEYSRAAGDPYYPVPAAENTALYKKYEELQCHETKTKNVYFSGRLAQYRYMNTDEAIEGALRVFGEMEKKLGRG